MEMKYSKTQLEESLSYWENRLIQRGTHKPSIRKMINTIESDLKALEEI
jgi:hypothetical protein